jgi:hypothetical protein
MAGGHGLAVWRFDRGFENHMVSIVVQALRFHCPVGVRRELLPEGAQPVGYSLVRSAVVRHFAVALGVVLG